jgi:hypothetical protein
MQQVQELKVGFQAHHGELRALAAELHGAVTSLSARLDDALGESADAHNDLARIKAMLQARFRDCRSEHSLTVCNPHTAHVGPAHIC